jgi:hypothetical protein
MSQGLGWASAICLVLGSEVAMVVSSGCGHFTTFLRASLHGLAGALLILVPYVNSTGLTAWPIAGVTVCPMLFAFSPWPGVGDMFRCPGQWGNLICLSVSMM